MLFSSGDIPRTVGYGKGGTLDRILHGSDSRHIDQEKHEPLPSLQTAFYQAMKGRMVMFTLINGEEVLGVLVNVIQEGARLMIDKDGELMMLCTRRVMYAIPKEAVHPVKAIEKNLQETLLAQAERGSRLMTMRRRLQQRTARETASRLIQRRE